MGWWKHETARGVTIVPDDIDPGERSRREANGEILVTETESVTGPVDFDC